MTSYDNWKTTNPADEFLGPEPDDGDDEGGEAARSAMREIILLAYQTCLKLADEVECQQEIDHGAANSGGAKAVADRLRDEIAKLSF